MFKAIKEFFLGKPVEQQPVVEAPAPYKVETPAPAPVAEIPTLTEVVEPVAEKPAKKKPAPKKQQFDKKPAAKKAGRKPKAKPEAV